MSYFRSIFFCVRTECGDLQSKSISAMIEQGLLLINSKKNALEQCININDESTQQIFTYSKSITETLEKDDTQSQLRRYNN